MVGRTRSSGRLSDKPDTEDDEDISEDEPLMGSDSSTGSDAVAKEQAERAARDERRRKALEFRHLHKVVFMRKELLLNTGDDDLIDLNDFNNTVHIIRLRHPHSSYLSHYICNHAAGRYYSLLRYQETNRSWLMSDKRITIDGTVFVTSRIDPLFLVLPYLMQASAGGHFVPLDQSLRDDRCPEVAGFVAALPISQLLLVADQRGDPDLRALRYCEEKTLDWLAFKCDKYVKWLAQRKIRIERNAKSETYVKSDKLKSDPGNDARLSMACSSLIENLPKSLHADLLLRVGAEVAKTPRVYSTDNLLSRASSTASSGHKRRPTDEAAAAAKRSTGLEKRAKEGGVAAAAGRSFAAPPPPPPVEKKVTAREKAMAKAASGTRGLLSFFKRK